MTIHVLTRVSSCLGWQIEEVQQLLLEVKSLKDMVRKQERRIKQLENQVAIMEEEEEEKNRPEGDAPAEVI